jgi:cellulose synthase (UDP-forming)
MIALLALVSVPHSAQIGFAVAGIAAMGVLLAVFRRLGQRSLRDAVSIAILTLGGFLTIRYIAWRIGYTIHFHGLASYLAAIALLAAEIYGIVLYFIGSLINARPRKRPIPDLDLGSLPTVDVYIPTYNEEPQLLEVTVLAATQLDYPANRFTVWVLDDGGTDAKRRQADPEAAAAAQARQHDLMALCERTGARYLTRKDNRHAKAGNVNAALQHTNGELVLILDADHVPTADLLRNTVGFFQHDPKLFLVQTPHRFITPDPVERNLDTWGRMPGESEMFYRIIQPGLDAWDASFFCGSAAVLRRKCLDELGGLSGETITEDAETAIRLHARGYRSAYVDKPMVFGLQPETFDSFVQQRCRWAQGMAQIFILRNPLFLKGLHWGQRLGYLSSTLFWFFSYARIVFIFAPVAYLVFGLKIYDANLSQFFAYAIPHLAGTLVTANLLFGRARWALVSELYEVVQSWFSSRAVMDVLRAPRSPTFKVTSKGGRLEEDFISPLAGPLYVMMVVLLTALGFGAWRYISFPEQREVIYITLAWAALNMVILMAALGALLEQRQRRRYPRINLAHPPPARLDLGVAPVEVRVADLSMGGCHVLLDGAHAGPRDTFGRLAVTPPGAETPTELPVRLIAADPAGRWARLEFRSLDTTEQRAVVGLGFGNSANTAWGIDRVADDPGILRGIGHFFWLGLTHGGAHLGFLLGRAFRNSVGRKLPALIETALGRPSCKTEENWHSQASLPSRPLQPVARKPRRLPKRA